MSKDDFSTAKAIDNYEKINKKSFLSLLFNLNKEDEKLSLSELLNKYSNINTVLIKQLDSRDLRLANRYFEAYVYDKENKATNNEAETDNCQTPHRVLILSCVNTEIRQNSPTTAFVIISTKM